MASPRPPPPLLPVIKEKTRTLQQKIRRRAAHTALNASASSLPDQSQSPFPVIHSTPSDNISAVESTPSTPLHHTSLVSAETAIARLRTYRDEQLLWHTAVEHHTRRLLLTHIHSWRQATQRQSHHNLVSLASRLSQQHSARRLRAAVQRWKTAAQASRQHRQRHGHLSRFHAHHLQHIYFIAWVAHTLHRKDKEVDALLAQSLYRSNTLRALWRLWKQTVAIAVQQRSVEQRAQQYGDTQLTQLALTKWRAQGSQAVKQREKERRAALLGDKRSTQYYLQRWRQLPSAVRKDEEAAPHLAQQTHRQSVRAAWRTWKEESEWRQAAQIAGDRLVRWRQQWLVKTAWEGWEGIVDNEKEDAQRAQLADQWHGRQHLRYAVRQWRAITRDAALQRIRGKHVQLELQQSLRHWRRWAHQQRLIERARRHYERNSAAQIWYWWRQQLQLSGNERHMRETARTHEYEHRMLSALVQWQQCATQQRQSRERMEAATATERTRLLRQGLSALSANCRQRHTKHHHASFIRRHQLQSAVVLLYQHALYQRHCWQLHLRAKRFRYFRLLHQAWRGWHAARRQEAAAEERLFAERCGGLMRDWTRQLFGAWLRLTSEQRVAREREVVALVQWRDRLMVEAWQEWQFAVLDRVDEQQQYRIADHRLQRNSQRHAITSWLSHTRFKRQVREAESEAVAVGQQQLHLLARRRVWQRFQLAFHTARSHHSDLNKADQHHNSRRLHDSLHRWHRHSAESARLSQLHAAAASTHHRRLLLLAWQHWLAIQTERRRLLALHVRAMEWRKVREERRIWQAWQRWLLRRRAKRQREADMRRRRVERLQVEGVRQWVMVGLEWMQQKQEMEIEARQVQQKREREQLQQRQVQQKAVAVWVRRIAEHWRHRVAKKDEAQQPLITSAQLTRWREAERRKRLPQQFEQHGNAAREEYTQALGAARAAAVGTAAPLAEPPIPSDFSLSSAAVPPTMVSRRARVRAEPRRHVELLLEEPLTSLPVFPVALDVSQLSASIPTHQQPRSRPRSPQPPSLPQPRGPSEMHRPAVDDALLAALSAPTMPSLDLTAIESRLQFLADLRAAYVQNKQELERLQAASTSFSGTTVSSRQTGQLAPLDLAAGDEAQHARCALLLNACLEFEQQRLDWKREVRQWQSTLRSAQLSSG